MKTINLEGKVIDFDKDYLASGTGRQLEVDMDYAEVVRLFGEPDLVDKDRESGNKVQCQWIISTPYGIATVYNYKDGINYMGMNDGLENEQIRNWHIGAANMEAAEVVEKVLLESLQA